MEARETLGSMKLPSNCPVHTRGAWIYTPWVVTVLLAVALTIAALLPWQAGIPVITVLFVFFLLGSYWHFGCRLIVGVKMAHHEHNHKENENV